MGREKQKVLEHLVNRHEMVGIFEARGTAADHQAFCKQFATTHVLHSSVVSEVRNIAMLVLVKTTLAHDLDASIQCNVIVPGRAMSIAATYPKSPLTYAFFSQSQPYVGGETGDHQASGAACEPSFPIHMLWRVASAACLETFNFSHPGAIRWKGRGRATSSTHRTGMIFATNTIMGHNDK